LFYVIPTRRHDGTAATSCGELRRIYRHACRPRPHQPTLKRQTDYTARIRNARIQNSKRSPTRSPKSRPSPARSDRNAVDRPKWFVAYTQMYAVRSLLSVWMGLRNLHTDGAPESSHGGENNVEPRSRMMSAPRGRHRTASPLATNDGRYEGPTLKLADEVRSVGGGMHVNLHRTCTTDARIDRQLIDAAGRKATGGSYRQYLSTRRRTILKGGLGRPEIEKLKARGAGQHRQRAEPSRHRYLIAPQRKSLNGKTLSRPHWSFMHHEKERQENARENRSRPTSPTPD